MPAQVLILWPNRERAEELQEAFTKAEAPFDVAIELNHLDRLELERRLNEKGLLGLIVGPSSGRGLEALAHAAEVAPRLALAAADEEEGANSMRAAMRAGAGDYLTPPFQVGEMAATVAERMRASRIESASGIVVAFVPSQGGDGASTMALHAAYALTHDIGQPALLVDCDLQCGTTIFRLHLEPRYTLADAHSRIDDLPDLWGRLITDWRGLHVLPAPDETLNLRPEDFVAMSRVVQAASRQYAFVIADLPPTLSPSSYEILKSADAVHLVCAPTLTSLHLARRKIQEMAGAGISASKVKLTIGRDGKRAVAGDKEIEKIIGLQIDWSIPNDFTTVSEAVFKGSLVPPETELGRKLQGLAFRIIGEEPRNGDAKTSGWLGLFSRH